MSNIVGLLVALFLCGIVTLEGRGTYCGLCIIMCGGGSISMSNLLGLNSCHWTNTGMSDFLHVRVAE